MSHSGDETFQAIDCTGTHNQKQRNKLAHAPETQTNKIHNNFYSHYIISIVIMCLKIRESYKFGY